IKKLRNLAGGHGDSMSTQGKRSLTSIIVTTAMVVVAASTLFSHLVQGREVVVTGRVLMASPGPFIPIGNTIEINDLSALPLSETRSVTAILSNGTILPGASAPSPEPGRIGSLSISVTPGQPIVPVVIFNLPGTSQNDQGAPIVLPKISL